MNIGSFDVPMHRVSLKRPYEIPGAPVLAEGSGPQGDRVMSEAGIVLPTKSVCRPSSRGRAAAALDGSGISFQAATGMRKELDHEHRAAETCLTDHET